MPRGQATVPKCMDFLGPHLCFRTPHLPSCEYLPGGALQAPEYPCLAQGVSSSPPTRLKLPQVRLRVETEKTAARTLSKPSCKRRSRSFFLNPGSLLPNKEHLAPAAVLLATMVSTWALLAMVFLAPVFLGAAFLHAVSLAALPRPSRHHFGQTEMLINQPSAVSRSLSTMISKLNPGSHATVKIISTPALCRTIGRERAVSSSAQELPTTAS
jgi:hypothetical protein